MDEPLPNCPYCGGATKYGERDRFAIAMGETPLHCAGPCGREDVGYRDHEFGDFVMDRTPKSAQPAQSNG